MEILNTIFEVVYCVLLSGGVFILALAFGYAVGGDC